MIRRRTVVELACLAAIVAPGSAIAGWMAGTSGAGEYAKATTASALVLSDAGASTVGDLYPGGTGDLKLKLANPNSFPVRITAVALTSGETITSNVVACNGGGTGVTLTNQTGLTLDLPANATATVFTIRGAVNMSTSSDTNCQGAVFTIPVHVTAAS